MDDYDKTCSSAPPEEADPQKGSPLEVERRAGITRSESHRRSPAFRFVGTLHLQHCIGKDRAAMICSGSSFTTLNVV